MTSALSLPSPLACVPELPEVTETQGTGQPSVRVWVLHAVSQFRSQAHTEALQVVTGGLRFTFNVYVCLGHVWCPQRPVGGTVPWNSN